MNNNYNKIITISLFALGIIFVVIGSTFAYLSTNVSNSSGIAGSTYKFDASINITTIKSGGLIPLADDLIDDTLNSNNVCVDINDNMICSLYQVTLTNRSSAIVMNGSLKTNSTTYTAGNLKYQLFTYSGGNYTAVSDMGIVPFTANDTSNFTLNSSNINVNLSAGTTSSPYSTDYYLAIWLSDSGNNQLVDMNKTYSGAVVFASGSNTMTSDFS